MSTVCASATNAPECQRAPRQVGRVDARPRKGECGEDGEAARAGAEVEDAANILLAAQATDWGPIQYKAELHDRATYRYYWEVLQKARVTGVALPAAAEAAFFAAG